MAAAKTTDQRVHQETQKRAKEQAKDEEDEMPLLFMDRLPSDFTSNAQLAAIATFMDDSDTEQCDDGSGDDSDHLATYTRASSKRQAKKRDAKRERKQAPYAKKSSIAAKSRSDASSAKELQLYLSMFQM